jgi:hypothetical protein
MKVNDLQRSCVCVLTEIVSGESAQFGYTPKTSDFSIARDFSQTLYRTAVAGAAVSAQ